MSHFCSGTHLFSQRRNRAEGPGVWSCAEKKNEYALTRLIWQSIPAAFE
jgi:hypothetical protein